MLWALANQNRSCSLAQDGCKDLIPQSAGTIFEVTDNAHPVRLELCDLYHCFEDSGRIAFELR